LNDQLKVNRKELEKEARKKDIIDAASRLFSERDYHAVKVDDIAERVGLSKGTIYLYYENKENLFFSIIIERAKVLYARLEQASQCETEFPDCLHKFVSTYLSFFRDHEAFFKIIHSEKTRLDMETHHKMHDYSSEVLKALFKVVIELMQKGQKNGVLRKDDPRTLSKILIALLNVYTFQRIILGEKSKHNEEVNEVVEYFLNGAKISN